jgi:DNA-binding transcriptional ArsR family regulator
VKRGKKNPTNDPYQQILSRLGNIEHKVDSIDETNAFALRAEAAKHENTVKQIFRDGKRRAQVYLAADGTRGVIEIAEYLGMKQPNVSLELRILKEEGLLEFTGSWAKKPIDRSLRISQYLCKEYGLRPDGKLKGGK